ncbi:helix-turn-helix domain-containing protein [Microbispora sp. H10670]|uniref:helix-turn-helix domain-containing protein n=1 Tax=Microbispora sp. H10670 TaxID=2729108 RepID=UPI001603583D|nr:helix-turn-helix transcriptional regulator [Microbispora sp. H10670]
MPDPIPPACGPWETLGAVLRIWRTNAGLGLRPAATQAFLDHSHLAKWERGERRPPGEAVAALDAIYGADGVLRSLHAMAEAADAQPQRSGLPRLEVDADDMHMERRQILRSFAVIAAAGAVSIDAVERVRLAMNETTGSDRVGDWEETAWEYGHLLWRDPPADVLPDLVLDAYALHRVMRGGPPGDAAAWARAYARMAYLTAQCLGFMEETREARHWWRTARRAAQQAADPEVEAAVLGFEAGQAQYSNRPAEVIMERARSAITVAAGRPCAGAAEAHSVLAQAAALAGDEPAALNALHALEELYDRLPAFTTDDTTTAFGWPPARLLHTRSLVLSRTAPAPVAEAAINEAVASYPAWRQRQITQVEMHRSVLALRTHGDVPGGIGHAATALDHLDTRHHTMFVRRAAQWVLTAVPAVAAASAPVADYRERLSLPPARRPLEA